MPYRATTVGGIGHLGRATFDGEKHVDPVETVCGIPVERWTVREPRVLSGGVSGGRPPSARHVIEPFFGSCWTER